MARKGLPRKYAKMGFKRGWAAYKRTTAAPRRQGVKVARKRTYRRRVYGAARRGYRKRKGLLSGNAGNVVIGAVAGFASPYIPRVLGGWTLPLAFGGAAYLLKKPALFSIAGYELGKTLSTGGLLGGLGGGNGGVSQV